MYAQQPAVTSVLERSFTHDQIKINSFKLGELNSGCMYPTSAPEQREDRSSWNAPRPGPPPLSENKRRAFAIPPPDRYLGDESARPKISPRATNGERLPSLSSLFSPTQGPLTSRCSYSNSSPTFMAESPELTGRKASTNHPDQLLWAPTYPRPHSEPSGQYPFNQQSSHSVSSNRLPPPPRSVMDHRKLDSPSYLGKRSSYRDEQYDRASTSSARWSPRGETSYRDNFTPMPKDASSPYGHPRDRKASSPQFQLGPNTWTGTHFLPRLLRQVEDPAEGICYFYNDSTHCKTVIDGEPVNAHWGVTKAGKPRKRLAIACITCREKKIKCNSDYPRCVQCVKFGRACKFKSA